MYRVIIFKIFFNSYALTKVAFEDFHELLQFCNLVEHCVHLRFLKYAGAMIY